MKRLFATTCRRALCVVLQLTAIGSAAAQPAFDRTLQLTAMVGTHAANAGAVMRRFIEPAEARALWDDPQIKTLVNETENAWDFVTPDGVPGFGPLPPEDVRKLLERHRDGARR